VLGHRQQSDRKLSSSDPVQIAMLKGLVAGAVNLALALLQGAQLPSAGLTAAVGGLGFLGYGVAWSCSCSDCATSAQRGREPISRSPFVGTVISVASWKSRFRCNWLSGRPDGLGLWLHLPNSMSTTTSTNRGHEHRHRHDAHHRHRHMLITSMNMLRSIRPVTTHTLAPACPAGAPASPLPRSESPA